MRSFETITARQSIYVKSVKHVSSHEEATETTPNPVVLVYPAKFRLLLSLSVRIITVTQ